VAEAVCYDLEDFLGPQRSRAHYAGRWSFRLLLSSDDLVVAAVPGLSAWDPQRLRRFGFVPKGGKVALEQLEFCSGVFYPVGGRYVHGPKLGRALCRIGVDLEMDQRPRAKCAAVASSMYQVSRYVPVLRQMVDVMQRLTAGVPFEAIRSAVHRIRPASTTAYDLSTIAFVSQRYGLREAEILELMRMVEGIEELHVYVGSPALAVIVERDN